MSRGINLKEAEQITLKSALKKLFGFSLVIDGLIQVSDLLQMNPLNQVSATFVLFV